MSKLWHNFNRLNKNVFEILKQGGGREGWEKKLFENVIAKIFPNLLKTINSHIFESQETPSTKT